MLFVSSLSYSQSMERDTSINITVCLDGNPTTSFFIFSTSRDSIRWVEEGVEYLSKVDTISPTHSIIPGSYTLKCSQSNMLLNSERDNFICVKRNDNDTPLVVRLCCLNGIKYCFYSIYTPQYMVSEHKVYKNFFRNKHYTCYYELRCLNDISVYSPNFAEKYFFHP